MYFLWMDIVAILLLLLLTRFTFWNSLQENPSAGLGGLGSTSVRSNRNKNSYSIHSFLAFYSEFHSLTTNLFLLKNTDDPQNKEEEEDANQNKKNPHEPRAASPTSLDINGDGLVDALVMPVWIHTTQSWELQILDLQPLHSTLSNDQKKRSTYVKHLKFPIPFYPKTLFRTNTTWDKDSLLVSVAHSITNTTTILPIFPIHIATQYLRLSQSNSTTTTTFKQKNAYSAIATLWSDGSLSLHSISKRRLPSAHLEKRNPLNQSQTNAPPKLTLDLRWWKNNVFHCQNENQTQVPSKSISSYTFHQLDILLHSYQNYHDPISKSSSSSSLLSLESEEPIIIIASHYDSYPVHVQETNFKREGNQNADIGVKEHYVILAMNAFTGKVLWSHDRGYKSERNGWNPPPFGSSPTTTTDPVVHPTLNSTHVQRKERRTSGARRRSILSQIASTQAHTFEEEDSVWSRDCPEEYKSWLLHLPWTFWYRFPSSRSNTLHDRKQTFHKENRDSFLSMIRNSQGKVGQAAIYTSYFSWKQQQQSKTNIQQPFPVDLPHNIVLFVTSSGDFYLHSIVHGKPVCTTTWDDLTMLHSVDPHIRTEDAFQLREGTISTFGTVQWNGLLTVTTQSAFDSRWKRSHGGSHVTRPIVYTSMVSTESKMIFRSPSMSDNVLSSINYPQQSIRTPILIQLKQDAVTDLILIETLNGLWGYYVVAGKRRILSSQPMRTLSVGLLLIFVFLAALYNRHQHSRKFGTRQKYFFGERSHNQDPDKVF